MNKKCPNCGFINFVHAEACRKCETILSDVTGASIYDSPSTYRGPVSPYHQPPPARSGSTVLKVLACVGVGVVLLALFAALSVGFISRKRKVSWTEYRPEGMDFTVMMPNQPTRLEPILTNSANGTMWNHGYVSTVAGQGVAMFVFVDYTGLVFEKEDAVEGLDAELNGFLKRTNATLVSKKKTTYLGMPAIEFEMTPPADMKIKAGRSYGKMFLSLNRLYLLSITASEGSVLLTGKDKFLNPQLPPNPFG